MFGGGVAVVGGRGLVGVLKRLDICRIGVKLCRMAAGWRRT